MVLIVCAPLKRLVQQGTEWATQDVRRWLALWRRTRPCTRWSLAAVSVLCCDLFFEGG